MKKINNVLLCIIIVIFTMTTGCGSKNNSDNKAVVVNSEGQVTSEALSKSDIDISSQTFDEKDSTGENESTFSENSTNEENINDANVNGDNINNPAEISLVMVGDVLLHTPVSDSGLMEDGSYNYSHLFKNVKNDIESADIALVNQEVILGGTELGLSGYPAFNGAYEVGDAIVEAGFDVVLHATNHALDKGRKGILNCINYWKNSHPDIGVIGINESQEEQNNIYIKEIDGMRIAILNYTYGTNGIALPSNMPYCVNLLDEDKIAKDMEIAKQSSDFIVVCPHWGTEYTHDETNEQKNGQNILLNWEQI